VRFRTDVGLVCTLNLVEVVSESEKKILYALNFTQPREYYLLFLDDVFALSRKNKFSGVYLSNNFFKIIDST
jgi:hypothetical protein